MFHFGLFATHIPYVLLTMAYMVYYGANILQDPREITSEEDAYMAQVYFSPSYEAVAEHACYADWNKCNTAQFDIEHPFYIKTHLEEIVWFEHSKNLINRWFYASQATRPPPFAVA